MTKMIISDDDDYDDDMCDYISKLLTVFFHGTMYDDRNYFLVDVVLPLSHVTVDSYILKY